MRELFALLEGVFGWVPALLSEGEDFAHNPTMIDGWHFFLPASSLDSTPWSINTLAADLREIGFDVWAATAHPINLRRLEFSDEYCITVRMAQAHEVERFLVDAGVQIAERSRGAPGGEKNLWWWWL